MSCLKAFSEEQKAEETMGTNKTKSKVRAKAKRSTKLDNEARKAKPQEGHQTWSLLALSVT